MFEFNDIKKLLRIKDSNIEIHSVEEERDKKGGHLVVYASLINQVSRCPECGQADEKTIVKNGGKQSRILLNSAGNQRTYLNLKKQRYLCRNCHSYFTAKTYLVDRFCFIAKQVFYKAFEELTEKNTAKNIAKHCFVSSSTLQKSIDLLAHEINIKKNWLPKCLLFDEFRSLTTYKGKFAFSCMDGDTGKLFDILPSRRKNDLVDYFMSFDRQARHSVRYVVSDMNAPYLKVVKICFPNAKLIIDRFHIVQHMNRCFDNLRVRVMKSLNQNDPEQAKQYRQLKKLNRLLLMSHDKLDFQTFKKRANFSWSYLTQTEIVDRLLTISEDLSLGYNYYQDLIYAFNHKDGGEFYRLLSEMPEEIPAELQILKRTFRKHEAGIRLSLEKSYSNAKLENIHTHIKVLKRVAYGYRNFANMRARIFLTNNLISIK
ncbi:ISL3 family transposase [Enterococcus timonensis]|uniref:ISL3 family transposase n=1 Tax=Enterococcus timonensis TaxID=1852364 RepID=UPI0008DB27A3|nr:ISL3 family transposase [Enterococcus timonensis]